MLFIRTCQSCDHVQPDNPPPKDRELSPAYCERRCKRCKSPDLDYGTWRNETPPVQAPAPQG